MAIIYVKHLSSIRQEEEFEDDTSLFAFDISVLTIDLFLGDVRQRRVHLMTDYLNQSPKPL